MKRIDKLKSRPVRAVSDAQITKALKATGGWQSQAAKKLNVTPSALCQRIKSNPKLQVIIENIKESYLDLAESRLMTLVSRGNLGAICFYLKCQARKRGYVENLPKTTGQDENEPIQPTKINFVVKDARRTPKTT